ncbi:MAG: hypothetical protein ACE366_04440 [Bradymonadia bacterium]
MRLHRRRTPQLLATALLLTTACYGHTQSHCQTTRNGKVTYSERECSASCREWAGADCISYTKEASKDCERYLKKGSR